MVEYDKLFKKKPKPIEKIYPKIDYGSLIINISCICLLALGIYILYKRQENKQINKLLYEKKVYDISKEILDNREE